ncbi:MAG: hypothetical protein M1813_005406 [Trichoglossum hirsutum]|nr:MAG: hypothetical protein M1813_005406 [Trichoglossum hirsutum]
MLSPARSSPSLSRPAQWAIGIIKDRECGRHIDGSWNKIRLERGDFAQLKERLEEEDLWGYVEYKIRLGLSPLLSDLAIAVLILRYHPSFDYDPENRYLVFRMPSGTHTLFTTRVVSEIKFQLQRISEDKTFPDIAAIAGSTDLAFRLTTFQPFRNDDGSPISPSAFLPSEYAQFPQDVAISIPFTTLFSFLEWAERIQANIGPLRMGRMRELPPGTEVLRRQETPKEQLTEADEARATAEEKTERNT